MFTFQKKFSIQVGEIAFHCHKLSARNLRKAAEAVTNKQISDWHRMGPDILEVLRSSSNKPAAAEAPAEAKPDQKALAEARYAQYDPFEVVLLSFEGWSLNDPVDDKTKPQIVDALDEDQISILSRKILDESLPALDSEAQKVTEGKDSAPSTNT
jgi:hypothetical protein